MENPILIQGAMDVETDYLIENLVNKNKKVINGYDFYEGELSSVPVVISITKVGSINASVSTILAINEFKPKCIINQGIAGGYMRDIHIGDILIVNTTFNLNSFKSSFKNIGEGSNSIDWNLQNWGIKGEELYLKASDELLNNVKCKIKNENGRIYAGCLASGDGWNNELDRINMFNIEHHAYAEDMETYAVFKVCNDNKVPVVGIRMISNNIIIDEKYDRNIAHKLQEEILNLIARLEDIYRY